MVALREPERALTRALTGALARCDRIVIVRTNPSNIRALPWLVSRSSAGSSGRSRPMVFGPLQGDSDA